MQDNAYGYAAHETSQDLYHVTSTYSSGKLNWSILALSHFGYHTKRPKQRVWANLYCRLHSNCSVILHVVLGLQKYSANLAVVKMGPKMRGKDIPEGVRAAIVMAKATKVPGYRQKKRRPTNKEITKKLQDDFDIYVDERTISHITIDTEKRAFKAGVSRLDHRALTARENCQANERLFKREKQALVKRTILNREQRRKP